MVHAMAEGDPISDTSDAFVDILNSLWRTNCCEGISDEIKQARFIIIQSLNGKDITLDIVIKYLA
jgi:hypothetical protein